MQLERIEIAGFRGIQRLSLSLDNLTTLLGENTWGKSSLLDALEIALPNDSQLYQFSIKDFHLDYVLGQPQSQSIHIITRWRTQYKGEENSGRYRRLKPAWLSMDNDPGHKQIIYQVFATRQDQKVTTSYQFLNQHGEVLQIHDTEKLALELISLHPVIRMRDARRLHQNPYNKHNQAEQDDELLKHVDTRKETKASAQELEARIQKRINNTYRRLNAMPGHVNKGEIKSSLQAMQHLVEHYFSFQPHQRREKRTQRDHLLDLSDHSGLLHILREGKSTQSKLLLMGLLQAYLQAKGNTQLRKMSRPILILEDPE
ncbi:MAG: DUF2813 domain-containing protein, partial [Vibrio sp.]